jgi:hypothetical protein
MNCVALPVTAVLPHILQAVFPVPYPNVLAYVSLGPLQEVGEIVLLEQKQRIQTRP